ncbi:MAG: hypothetical protein AABY15_04845 [Nanoarchaeota archaeon]
MINCSQCKKEYPDNFGGTLCPRCEDFMFEAQQERRDEDRKERMEAKGEIMEED